MTTPEPKTFIHKFGGWHEAETRRWTNQDGSVGGIVAVTATVHADTVIPQSCEVWPYASIEYGARIGSGASIEYGASIAAQDWFISGGPCGSRNAMWTAGYSAEHGLRWWVGCKHGITTEELVRLVDETHRGTTHYDDYLAAIAFVTSHPALKRAMANSQGAEQ